MDHDMTTAPRLFAVLPNWFVICLDSSVRWRSDSHDTADYPALADCTVGRPQGCTPSQ